MTPEQALTRLQAQCSRSEMCSGQVRRRLLRWSVAQQQKGLPGFSDHQVEEIVDIMTLCGSRIDELLSLDQKLAVRKTQAWE